MRRSERQPARESRGRAVGAAVSVACLLMLAPSIAAAQELAATSTAATVPTIPGEPAVSVPDAVARQLYELGFGSLGPDGRPDADLSLSIAGLAQEARQGMLAAWRRSRRSTTVGPMTSAEQKIILAQPLPGKWAAMTVGAARVGSVILPAARTWNRPSRIMAERIVFERCETLRAQSESPTPCRLPILVTHSGACLAMAVATIPMGAYRFEKAIVSGPHVGAGTAATAAAARCRAEVSRGASCKLRSVACGDGVASR